MRYTAYKIGEIRRSPSGFTDEDIAGYLELKGVDTKDLDRNQLLKALRLVKLSRKELPGSGRKRTKGDLINDILRGNINKKLSKDMKEIEEGLYEMKNMLKKDMIESNKINREGKKLLDGINDMLVTEELNELIKNDNPIDIKRKKKPEKEDKKKKKIKRDEKEREREREKKMIKKYIEKKRDEYKTNGVKENIVILPKAQNGTPDIFGLAKGKHIIPKKVEIPRSAATPDIFGLAKGSHMIPKKIELPRSATTPDIFGLAKGSHMIPKKIELLKMAETPDVFGLAKEKSIMHKKIELPRSEKTPDIFGLAKGKHIKYDKDKEEKKKLEDRKKRRMTAKKRATKNKK